MLTAGTAEIMLVVNGHVSSLTDDEAFDLVIRIATSCSEIEVKEIAASLKVVTRPSAQ